MAAKPRDIQSAPVSKTQAELQKEEAFGFQDWKQKRILIAKISMDEFRISLAKNEALKSQPPSSGEAGKDTAKLLNNSNLPQEKPSQVQPSAESSDPQNRQAAAQDLLASKQLEERMRQLEFNLEIAQGLTIHDYFALYLKDKSKEDMAKAIQKLNPEELSELLAAYRNVLYGSPRVEKDKVNDLN